MDIRDKVKARVDAIGKSPITLARSVGLERGFINDILIGRKRSIRHDKLPLVAQALECEPAYLTGEGNISPAPASPHKLDEETETREGSAKLRSIGICELGVWRGPNAGFVSAEVAIPPDPRFHGAPQLCYEVRGDGMAGMGVVDGMTVVGIEYEHFIRSYRPLETGVLVVVERNRAAFHQFELSLRRVDVRANGVWLTAVPAIGPPESLEVNKLPPGETIVIQAVITMAQLLLLPGY